MACDTIDRREPLCSPSAQESWRIRGMVSEGRAFIEEESGSCGRAGVTCKLLARLNSARDRRHGHQPFDDHAMLYGSIFSRPQYDIITIEQTCLTTYRQKLLVDDLDEQ